MRIKPHLNGALLYVCQISLTSRFQPKTSHFVSLHDTFRFCDYTILHLLTVGLMGANDNEKTVGFLHDLIEDCDWSIEDLQTEGFLDEVVEAVDILTHRKDEDSYDEYVDKIILSGNRLAINVKLNDLHHNLQRGKVSYETAVASNDAAKIKELKRINAKHEKALEMIKNVGYEQ
mgnify:CR=1 FL=1